MKQIPRLSWCLLAATLLAAGCRGLPATGEKTARQNVATVGGQVVTNGLTLTTNATLTDCVLLAAQHHPAVIAAYADWAAAVENVTVARSRPDPKVTLDLSIVDAIKSTMSDGMSDALNTGNDAVQSVSLGLITDIPGPGKRAARAAAALAESRARYFQFQTAVQQAAFAVEKSFYPLYFLEAKLQVNRQTLALLANLEALARAQNEVGRATLQDVLRAQIEAEQLRNETENLEDSRQVLLAQFKAALGVPVDQPDPIVPTTVSFSATNEDDEAWLALAWERNPQLKALAAEIQAAEAGLRVARKEKWPDFTAGIAADVKASPVIWDPQLSMTLPIWRDKLAAQIAAAQRTRQAAVARLSSAQIDLAVDFAEQTYMLREANRELTLLLDRLLPRARQSLAVSRAAYRSGQVDFLNVMDAERTLLNFQLDEIAAQTQREIARAELRLVVAGISPPGAPALKTDKPQPVH